MAVIYIHVDHEAYKFAEEQMRAFRETTHRSTGGFYHKSIRLNLGNETILEIHGPLVGGYGHQNNGRRRRRKVPAPANA